MRALGTRLYNNPEHYFEFLFLKIILKFLFSVWGFKKHNRPPLKSMSKISKAKLEVYLKIYYYQEKMINIKLVEDVFMIKMNFFLGKK